MKQFVKLLIYAGVILGIAGVILPKIPVPIRVTQNGFFPKHIFILPGMTVRFRSDVQRPIWPASNYHPTHGVYPQFDAKKPIPAGKSWEFRFNEPGIWEYHDHIAPKFTGSIRVLSILPWRATADADSCGRASGDKVTCWVRLVRTELSKNGLQGALSKFSSLYSTEKGFPSTCHDVAHVIGDAAYTQYKRKGNIPMPRETSYCGYGFYHGFIEALIRDGNDFGEARRMCERIEEDLSGQVASSQGKNSCFHGVGHGAFDSVPYAKWGNDTEMVREATAICSRFAGKNTGELFRICTTGIFNALAIAYQTNSYYLVMNREDPLALCKVQPDLLKKGCFIELGVTYVRLNSWDTPTSLSYFTQNFPEIQASYMVFAYMADEIRARTGNEHQIQALYTRCTQYERLVRDACIEGITHGIVTWGMPGNEWNAASEFCQMPELTPEDRNTCYSYGLMAIKGMYSSGEFENICSDIPAKYQKLCAQ